MFKLRSSTTSPFVRKVRVIAIETGQDSEIELVPTVTADPGSDLPRDNPLGKIPALALPDGTSLYDSQVICEFLDSRHQGRKFFPAAGPARWTALRRAALASGIAEAGLLCVMESRRVEGERSAGWVTKQKQKITQGLDALEREAADFGSDLDIGLMTIIIALDYIDFRFKADAWREGRPNLAKWHEAMSARPSFKSTLPHD